MAMFTPAQKPRGAARRILRGGLLIRKEMLGEAADVNSPRGLPVAKPTEAADVARRGLMGSSRLEDLADIAGQQFELDPLARAQLPDQETQRLGESLT